MNKYNIPPIPYGALLHTAHQRYGEAWFTKVRIVPAPWGGWHLNCKPPIPWARRHDA